MRIDDDDRYGDEDWDDDYEDENDDDDGNDDDKDDDPSLELCKNPVSFKRLLKAQLQSERIFLCQQ